MISNGLPGKNTSVKTIRPSAANNSIDATSTEQPPAHRSRFRFVGGGLYGGERIRKPDGRRLRAVDPEQPFLPVVFHRDVLPEVVAEPDAVSRRSIRAVDAIESQVEFDGGFVERNPVGQRRRTVYFLPFQFHRSVAEAVPVPAPASISAGSRRRCGRCSVRAGKWRLRPRLGRMPLRGRRILVRVHPADENPAVVRRVVERDARVIILAVIDPQRIGLFAGKMFSVEISDKILGRRSELIGRFGKIHDAGQQHPFDFFRSFDPERKQGRGIPTARRAIRGRARIR